MHVRCTVSFTEMLPTGRQEGVKALVGGDLGGGHYAQTTILEDRNKMRAFQEEIFGPVVSARKFKDGKEALSTANDTLHGLGVGV